MSIKERYEMCPKCKSKSTRKSNTHGRTRKCNSCDSNYDYKMALRGNK